MAGPGPAGFLFRATAAAAAAVDRSDVKIVCVDQFVHADLPLLTIVFFLCSSAGGAAGLKEDPRTVSHG
jgi:hypothetical protein